VTDKDEQARHTSTAAVVAGAMFHVVTGQTPEHFAHGMWEKARSISIDPILRLYGPDGMLNRAADKAVDKATGVEKPDSAYVSKEEHAAYLGDIIAVGAALFPGLGEASAAGPQRAMVTPEGAVVHPPAAEAAARPAVPTPPVLLAEKRGSGEPPAQKEGPGRWTHDLTGGENMKPDAAKYQEQISGHKADETYHLNGRAFDGFQPGKNGEKGTLLEAKNLGDDGRFVKAYEAMQRGDYRDFPHLYERATNILEEARGQVRAAEGTGLNIKWDVSSEKGAEAIRALFDHDPELKGRITVEHVPMKTETAPPGPGGDKAAAATKPPAATKPEQPPTPERPQTKPETPANPNTERPQGKPPGDPPVPRPQG
jgi:hypothetical protein